jgi:heme/copper-type cytochrome/quinol oxidase subunit 3
MATAAATATTPLALAPPAPPRRPRVLLIGSALAAGASALTILTMLAVHLAIRGDLVARGQDTLPEGATIPLTPGTMNMGTLLMAAITAAWTVYALRNQDRPHAYLALSLTLLLGIASIVQTAFLYEEMGLVIAESPQALLIYAISGAHIAMTVAGLAFLAVMGFHALGGQLTGRDADAMSAATLYWYATVAVYAVLWYGIYVTK